MKMNDVASYTDAELMKAVKIASDHFISGESRVFMKQLLLILIVIVCYKQL